MSRFDELTTADLATLAAWLESDKVQVDQLEPSQWLALVELMTAMLTDVADTVNRDWRLLSNAYFRCLSLAKSSGVLDEFDSAVRSLNFDVGSAKRIGASRIGKAPQSGRGDSVILSAASLVAQ
ncbi:hypothetical protein [Phytohabitans suffuscus]|uniref:Uncharacterized protein n=1 Tax=Phytohabitans suffuscus TaxID=624315 RepID=A0A6F8Z111_9ACTN|nr:hypothetical protein [Phytohabitans suffuscus]BCB92014.1 hypothetical protein Psuf_093270 [Phytohabitans suffuscus]